MPNIVNDLLVSQLKREVESTGSCLFLAFDKMTVAQAEGMRKELRGAGLRYRVVRNRLAIAAFGEKALDVKGIFKGKCGVVFAPDERAIDAAKLLREHYKKLKVKEPPVTVVGAVIEGEVIDGGRAAGIADMPDRKTVQAQLASVIAAPMRGLAVALSGLTAGMARCLQAKIDKDGDVPA